MTLRAGKQAQRVLTDGKHDRSCIGCRACAQQWIKLDRGDRPTTTSSQDTGTWLLEEGVDVEKWQEA